MSVQNVTVNFSSSTEDQIFDIPFPSRRGESLAMICLMVKNENKE